MANSNASNDPKPQTIVGLAPAAEYLGVKERKFHTLVKCNAVPHHSYGRRKLFLPEELMAWVHAGCPEEPGSAEWVRKGMQR